MKRKYISVEVEAEICLNDIDLQDIFDHIVYMAKNGDKDDKKQITDFRATLGMNPNISVKNETKVDDWKDELWPEIKQKFTLEQLETFLNS